MASDGTSRRDLLRLAAAGVGLAEALRLAKSVSGMPFVKKDTVPIGLIGTGGRGKSHIDNFGYLPGPSFAALCDVVKDKVCAPRRGSSGCRVRTTRRPSTTRATTPTKNWSSARTSTWW